MNAKEIAEGMLDGSLNYAPEDDAHFIAESYLKMHEAVREIYKLSQAYLPVEDALKSCLESQSYDPAKDDSPH